MLWHHARENAAHDMTAMPPKYPPHRMAKLNHRRDERDRIDGADECHGAGKRDPDLGKGHALEMPGQGRNAQDRNPARTGTREPKRCKEYCEHEKSQFEALQKNDPGGQCHQQLKCESITILGKSCDLGRNDEITLCGSPVCRRAPKQGPPAPRPRPLRQKSAQTS